MSTVQRAAIDFKGLVVAGLIVTVIALTADPAILMLLVVFEGVSKASFCAQAECFWLKKPLHNG